jgi:hypothetical protein
MTQRPLSSSSQRKQPSTLALQPATSIDVTAADVELAEVTLMDVVVVVVLVVGSEVISRVVSGPGVLATLASIEDVLEDVEVEDEPPISGMVAVPLTQTRPRTPVPLSSVPLGQAPTQSPLCR